MIGELLGNAFNALLDAFIKPLFNALKPLFMIAIIVIVIIIAIKVGKPLYSSNKKRRDEQKYIDTRKSIYANRSKSELVEIYNFLMRLENCRKKAAKKNVYAQSRDEQESALISSIGVTMLEEELIKKYPFIAYKYRHHDIAYLKKLI